MPWFLPLRLVEHVYGGGMSRPRVEICLGVLQETNDYAVKYPLALNV